MGRLDGKVAIITGGSAGMGASNVKMFVKEGAKVVFTDLNIEDGQKLEQELGNNAIFMEQDVSKSADWDKVIEKAEAEFGPIDILVNNAGISVTVPLEDMTEEQYQKVIDVNQLSIFLGMKKVLPSMKKTNAGSIINVSSIAGMAGGVGQVAYSASKFAVRGMTRSAAAELGKYNIRVNSVHPGAIKTPMIDQPENREVIKALEANTPLGKIGAVEDSSYLIVYLASDESSFTTGSEIVFDGGVTATL